MWSIHKKQRKNWKVYANFVYENELDKACFQPDMADGKSNDLPKRTQSNKVLKGKAFKIASNPK